MSRKRHIAIFVCFIVISLLAGCGQESDNPVNEVTERTLPVDTPEIVKEASQKSADDEAISNEAPQVEPQMESQMDAGLNLKQAESTLKEMSDALGRYLWYVMLCESGFEMFNPEGNGDVFTLNLSNTERIKAATLASDHDNVIDSYFILKNGELLEDRNVETGPYGDGFHGISVSKESIERNCIDLFGSEADWDALSTTPQSDIYDVVKYTDETGTFSLVLSDEVETETDLENHECAVIEENGEYIGKVRMFWGYWGQLAEDPDYSNYEVTYRLEPSNKSRYGMIITAIDIQQTVGDSLYGADEEIEEKTEAMGTDLTVNHGNTYYGVFVAAFKDENDCSGVVEQLREAGFTDCSVVYTPDFSELNPEPYYAVAAGLYNSKESANETLEQVKAAGYTDAYIKYAGIYTGDNVFH